jgi:hypothetical protein
VPQCLDSLRVAATFDEMRTAFDAKLGILHGANRPSPLAWIEHEPSKLGAGFESRDSRSQVARQCFCRP